MAAWRFTSAEECPLDDTPVSMGACEPCAYFRGASSSGHGSRGWNVCCNWPRSGSFVAPPRERSSAAPIPDAFRTAFEEAPHD